MLAKLKNGFHRMIWKYLPDCKDITALVSRSMEKDLSWRERLVMQTHLYTCLSCERYLKQLEFMSEVFEKQDAQRRRGGYEPRLSEEASERLKNALKSSKLLFLCVLAYCY